MRRILTRQGTCMGEYPTEESCLLVDARQYYRAFYQAALAAERYILIAGWQFDSEVQLLRGDDAARADGPTALLPFLAWLCKEKPDLRIYLLAWDYSILYIGDRELLQKWIFNWKTCDSVRFLFDSAHPVGASHHQKFVVVDGTVAFAGGIDLGTNRWDDRDHRTHHEFRKNARGEPYEAYHDLQCFIRGAAASELAGLFCQRWSEAGGDPIDLPVARDVPFSPEPCLPLPSGRVALCRTYGQLIQPPREPVREIRTLFIAAIESAEKLIYIENQYFSSEAVYHALMRRLEDTGRPGLGVILIMPEGFHGALEKYGVGLVQQKMLTELKKTAAAHGHSLGVYWRRSLPVDEASGSVYIHSKILIVDDRFITVGSANTSNRSMGLDTELNLAWEAEEESDPLGESIRAIRLSLLQEHTGLEGAGIPGGQDLIRILDREAANPVCPLEHLKLDSITEAGKFVELADVEDLALDPEEPLLPEKVYEAFSSGERNLFSRAFEAVRRLGHRPTE